jgi:hypothetical protein
MIYPSPKHEGHCRLKRVVTHGRFSENAIRSWIGRKIHFGGKFHFSKATPQQIASAIRYIDHVMFFDGQCE